MADDSVLSKDEIDALLSTSNSDSDEDEPGNDSGQRVRSYDFTQQHGATTGRLPFLEVVNEKFARKFRQSLQLNMRMGFDVQLGGTQILPFRELTQQLKTPTQMTLFDCSPFAGIGLVGLDAGLIFMMIDQYFGGTATAQVPEGRDFTHTERRVSASIVELLRCELEASWRELIEVELHVRGEEYNPSLISDIAPSELLVVSPFRLEFAGVGGEFRYAIPLRGLEPHRQKLDRAAGLQQLPADPAWADKLGESLRDASLAVNCCVAETELRLGRMMSMQAGEVIAISMPKEHLVRVEGKGLFLARLGESNGNLALEYLRDAQGVGGRV